MTQNPATHNPETNPTQRRRLLYGSNLALLAIIVTALVVFLNYAAQFRSTDGAIHPLRWDASAAGVNSLAPATKKLLAEIDQKKLDFELATTFTGPASRTDIEQSRLVDDLLQEYRRQSPHVKIYDLEGGRDKLEQKIAEKYAGEMAPYKAVLEDFDKKGGLADQLDKFFKDQGPGFAQVASTTKDEETAQLAGSFQVMFSSQAPTLITKQRKSLQKTLDSVLPDWGSVKTDIASLLTNLQKFVGPLSEPKKLEGQLPKPLLDYLTQANAGFKKVADDIKAYQDRLGDLKELKIDEVRRDLRSDSILVFGPASVKVLSKYDVFKSAPGAAASNENSYTFEGEQAISSALMTMVRPDKPTVVFVGTAPPGPQGPTGLSTGQFSSVAEQLKRNNFDVKDWAPPGPPMGPDSPPPQMKPPAQGKGVVWVVFPPEGSPMMPGMPQNNGPLVAAVKEHLDNGGGVLFLAEAANPMMSMGGGDPGYPFAELIKPFGITVKSDFTALRLYPAKNGATTPVPEITFTHFPDHPITKPLESLQTLFAGNRSRFGYVGAPTVVQTEGAARVIVQTDRSPEIFATKNIMSQEVKFDPTADLASPVPMGAAATRDAAGKEQRIVVLGNRMFAINDIVDAQGGVTENGALKEIITLFPGNGELFCNSVYWLAGYENMIAVSAKANAAQRIKITEQTLGRVRWLLILFGLPLAALTLGGAILIRRRR